MTFKSSSEICVRLWHGEWEGQKLSKEHDVIYGRSLFYNHHLQEGRPIFNNALHWCRRILKQTQHTFIQTHACQSVLVSNYFPENAYKFLPRRSYERLSGMHRTTLLRMSNSKLATTTCNNLIIQISYSNDPRNIKHYTTVTFSGYFKS